MTEYNDGVCFLGAEPFGVPIFLSANFNNNNLNQVRLLDSNFKDIIQIIVSYRNDMSKLSTC
jgi:hypothetical protein